MGISWLLISWLCLSQSQSWLLITWLCLSQSQLAVSYTQLSLIVQEEDRFNDIVRYNGVQRFEVRTLDPDAKTAWWVCPEWVKLAGLCETELEDILGEKPFWMRNHNQYSQ